jgi:hypothetical protein
LQLWPPTNRFESGKLGGHNCKIDAIKRAWHAADTVGRNARPREPAVPDFVFEPSEYVTSDDLHADVVADSGGHATVEQHQVPPREDDPDGPTATYTTYDYDSDGNVDMMVVDGDSDGRPETIYRDTDDDGRWNEIQHDYNEDGRFENVWRDTDGNGYVDAIATDSDGDGHPEITRRDTDGDGTFDRIEYDRNSDGHLDSVGYDRDGDGNPEFKLYGAAHAADEIRHQP